MNVIQKSKHKSTNSILIGFTDVRNTNNLQKFTKQCITYISHVIFKNIACAEVELWTYIYLILYVYYFLVIVSINCVITRNAINDTCDILWSHELYPRLYVYNDRWKAYAHDIFHVILHIWKMVFVEYTMDQIIMMKSIHQIEMPSTCAMRPNCK